MTKSFIFAAIALQLFPCAKTQATHQQEFNDFCDPLYETLLDRAGVWGWLYRQLTK